MYYTLPGYQTVPSGTNCAYYNQIFFDICKFVISIVFQFCADGHTNWCQ